MGSVATSLKSGFPDVYHFPISLSRTCNSQPFDCCRFLIFYLCLWLCLRFCLCLCLSLSLSLALLTVALALALPPYLYMTTHTLVWQYPDVNGLLWVTNWCCSRPLQEGGEGKCQQATNISEKRPMQKTTRKHTNICAHKHTNTQTHEHTNTQAHKHTHYADT